MTWQLRLAEQARSAAQRAVENNIPRDAHGLIRGSFAELVYLNEYDRTVALLAKSADNEVAP